MSLLRLDITDFRNLTSLRLEPQLDGFNFLFGHNGSGKTSLLEAIYYLSRGRSFRSSSAGHIINKSSDKFSIFAQVQTASQATPVGIERNRGGESRIRVAGLDDISLADLVRLTPALLINANCHNLLESGPVFRRKYLDWGTFYLTNDFLRIWKQYERVLKQRNAALRGRISKKELGVWTNELLQTAQALNQLRKEFVEQLLPFIHAALTELLVIPGLKLQYYPGWDESLGFEDVIAQALDKDIGLGYTQYGPHRADFKVTVGQTAVKEILSRGQQKLFVCAMIVAQGALLQQAINRKPIYLIDDLPSELDIVSRTNLIALLSRQAAQVFMTAVDRDALFDSFGSKIPLKMFHVEHGVIKEEAS